jgi:hypothetical protein
MEAPRKAAREGTTDLPVALPTVPRALLGRHSGWYERAQGRVSPRIQGQGASTNHQVITDADIHPAAIVGKAVHRPPA